MGLEPLTSEFADDPEMRELLEMFGAGIDDTVVTLQRAIASGDLETLKRVGHQLKGAGGGYGYPLVTEAGAKLEQVVAAAEAFTPDVQTAAELLATVCQRVQQGLQ